MDLTQVAALEMRHLFEAQRALYVNDPGANDGTYGDQESSDPSFTELNSGHFGGTTHRPPKPFCGS